MSARPVQRNCHRCLPVLCPITPARFVQAPVLSHSVVLHTLSCCPLAPVPAEPACLPSRSASTASGLVLPIAPVPCTPAALPVSSPVSLVYQTARLVLHTLPIVWYRFCLLWR